MWRLTLILFLLLTGGLTLSLANPPVKINHECYQSDASNVGDQKMLLRSLSLNRWPAFAVMPGIDEKNLHSLNDSYTKGCFWSDFSSGVQEMLTMMRMQDLESEEYGFPMVSNRDENNPIILVPSRQTKLMVEVLPKNGDSIPPPTVLLSLQTRNSKGEWKDAGLSKRKFYSYAREGEAFTIKFDKNHTGKFRAVKMTIADRDIPVERNTWPLPGPHRHSRTWIFVQLPESDDPDYLLDHLWEAAPDIFPAPRKHTTPPEFIGPDGYPYDWVSATDIMIHNLQLNDEFAFIILPLMSNAEIKHHLEPLQIPNKPSLATMMTLETLDPSFTYFSSQDMEHPIILVCPFKTKMVVMETDDFPNNIIPMELAALKVPDGNGGWTDASEEERQFYSYRRTGIAFAMTFPENKSPDFRCIAMTIRTADGYNPPDGQQGPISRTWLFIQLPWTDDPDIFNHIPYIDFTVDKLNLSN